MYCMLHACSTQWQTGGRFPHLARRACPQIDRGGREATHTKFGTSRMSTTRRQRVKREHDEVDYSLVGGVGAAATSHHTHNQTHAHSVFQGQVLSYDSHHHKHTCPLRSLQSMSPSWPNQRTIPSSNLHTIMHTMLSARAHVTLSVAPALASSGGIASATNNENVYSIIMYNVMIVRSHRPQQVRTRAIKTDRSCDGSR